MGEGRLTGLVQPDRRSCGAAVVVATHLLTTPPEAPADVAKAWFRTEVLAVHRQLTSVVDAGGRWQLPWLRALGTPPWAVARYLSGVTGDRYRTVLLCDRRSAFDRVLRAARDGRPVPVYVGNRWLPRHVVLVTGVGPEGTLRCYDPARGVVATVTRREFGTAELGLSGWDRPWFVVLPATHERGDPPG
jgi:hypothetical protein